ncbi:MAG: hypothetical protein D3925_02560, partial [Candidatus Electrothrix sp. AR5]|nr:hypothetical protein [Candidatus Electrothrix sp. AR5]
ANEYTEKQKSQFKANGTVLFEGAIIKGVFECYEGLFNAPERLALSLAGSRIEGYISLINSDVIGTVRLNCARIGAHLDLSGSRLSSNFGPTLNADNIQVGGNITGIDFKSAGSISLLDAQIKGILNWQQGTEICYKDGVALKADRIQSRGIYLRDGFKTDGEISILGAIIDGSLICTNGQFFDISAENVSVKGNVHLDQLSNSDNYFQSVGKVSLHNADIDGSLICTGGSFVDLSAPNMVVRGDVKLNGDATSSLSLDQVAAKTLLEKKRLMACKRQPFSFRFHL